MNRSILFAFAACLLLATFTAATDVRKCSSGAPLPLAVDVQDCAVMPCDAIKGKTAIMDVHFVGTKDDLRNLKTKVYAFALGMPITYDLPADVADVCGNLMYGAMCPIDKTEDVVYNFQFYVDLFYPEISVKLEVALVDEDINETVACFGVDIKVKKGATRNADAIAN